MGRVKVSIAQQNHLIKFMKAHPEFAKVRTCSIQGKIDYERQWLQLTKTLNSLGGPIKSVDKWKQTWRDLRYGVKRKAMKHRTDDELDESKDETDLIDSLTQPESPELVSVPDELNGDQEQNLIGVLMDIEKERLRIQKKELLVNEKRLAIEERRVQIEADKVKVFERIATIWENSFNK